jgi:hypothetical protein
LYRREQLLAIWRRPKLTARGDPAMTTWSPGSQPSCWILPHRAVVLAEDETPLNLAFTHRSLAAGLRVLLLAT